MKFLLVGGARPNFMKIAPISRSAESIKDLKCLILHTGQHYDYQMSQSFFEDLSIPEPNYFLESGSGSHAAQTAKIMVAFERVCEIERPEVVIVVGDVNSTLACSIVSKKMGIKVAHVEAGLRSFDMEMPEEINRIVTDSISDLYFVSEESGRRNLIKEGKDIKKIHFVGNVMIDNLLFQKKKLEMIDKRVIPTIKLKKRFKNYAFLTLHRPSNVDSKKNFEEIVSALNEIAEIIPILFPVHPRTLKSIQNHKIEMSDRIVKVPPLGFKEALFLWKDADIVLTDSGGLQEETTALGVRCVTIRKNTERPITIEMGTNRLAGTSRKTILDAFNVSMSIDTDKTKIPPFWDGKASERIWQVLLENKY
jgi:UDP-N-acetylglucosamine 2-epimerase (non-hydrolysing)